VLFHLGIALRAHVETHKLGVVLPDVEVLFVTGQFLRPDLVFVPEHAREGISDRGIELPPGLIVEIQSPTSAAIDRVKKPRRYGDFGVPEYWVVDPQDRIVWVWRFSEGATEAEQITDQLTWQPAGASVPLVVQLSELFRPM
jgi:Uma2 family endonuclease